MVDSMFYVVVIVIPLALVLSVVLVGISMLPEINEKDELCKDEGLRWYDPSWILLR